MTRPGSQKLRVPWLALSFLTLVVALLLTMRMAAPEEPGRELAFTELLAMISRGDASSVTVLGFDSRAVVHTSEGVAWAAFSSADKAVDLLAAATQGSGVPVSIDQQTGKQAASFLARFVLPVLLLANLFGLLFLGGTAGGSDELLRFSRLRQRRSQAGEPTTFADVAGIDRAVDELRELVEYLAGPERFHRMGALPPKGILLVGPPGCGKTLLSRAVAGEAGVPFLSISGSEFMESLVGVGAARVRDLFDRALDVAPAVVFIDELDAVGRRRGAGIGGGHDEREQTLNELLVQLDGFHRTTGIIVLAATNRPDILDPSLLRPGRFDRKITVELPDPDGREAILRLHAAGKPLGDDVDLAKLAKRTAGFSGADLANVLNEATLLTVRGNHRQVGWSEITEAIERVLAGPRTSAQRFRPDELRRVAYHEAGHAIAAARRRGPSTVDKVTIAARGHHIGHLQVLQRDDRSVVGRGDLLEELEVTMAGLAAEELVFGEPSTASEQDLERATDLARRIVARYGMSDRLGRMQVLEREEEIFLGRDYLSAPNVSSSTLEAVDAEVRQLLMSAEERASQLLLSERQALDRLAEALLHREVVEDGDLFILLTEDEVDRDGTTT